MKSIRSLDVRSMVMYGAFLAALWTLIFGIYYWILGWIFGAQSWFIDMNLANWTGFTLLTLLSIIWKMFINGLGGGLAGAIIAWVYNLIAAGMGGIKLNIED